MLMRHGGLSTNQRRAARRGVLVVTSHVFVSDELLDQSTSDVTVIPGYGHTNSKGLTAYLKAATTFCLRRAKYISRCVKQGLEVGLPPGGESKS